MRGLIPPKDRKGPTPASIGQPGAGRLRSTPDAVARDVCLIMSPERRLAVKLEQALQGRQGESHSGAAKAAHGQAAAQKRLERGLAVLGLRANELEDLPKGGLEKVALAWWLRAGTTVSLRWVSERLKMGHSTRVSQAISRMRRRPGRRLEGLRRKLGKLR